MLKMDHIIYNRETAKLQYQSCTINTGHSYGQAVISKLIMILI